MPPDNGYYFGYYFYSPQGRFEPCGMFTASHITTAFLCLAVVISMLLIFCKRPFDEFHKQRLSRKMAILLTVLEIIKITHSFIFGDYHLDAWFPLSYCGLFIFALWMAGYGKGRIKRAGEVFIAYGCAFAGVCFLIFPTTSLMLFPIWHYFSVYSMFFHTAMIYVSVRFLLKEPIFTKNTYLYYIGFVALFAFISIVMNCIFGCNLMNLREPFNIPIQVLQDIYNSFQPAYTAIGMIIYMLVPLITAAVFGKFSLKSKEKSA